MTQYELELYRKCMRKKKRYITRADYEIEHEYDNETNNIGYEKE